MIPGMTALQERYMASQNAVAPPSPAPIEKKAEDAPGIVEGESRQNRWRKKNKATIAAYMRDYRAKKKAGAN